MGQTAKKCKYQPNGEHRRVLGNDTCFFPTSDVVVLTCQTECGHTISNATRLGYSCALKPEFIAYKQYPTAIYRKNIQYKRTIAQY